MNYSMKASPLEQTNLTKDKMGQWLEAQRKGIDIEIDVYGKASDKQLKELDHVRKISQELQENLHDLESYVRVGDVEKREMNPTAPVLDFSEDHEFVSANQLDDYYSQEETKQTKNDAKEAEKRKLTKGKEGLRQIFKTFTRISVCL